MNIGLIDVDSYNFPNLVLMKLSTYYKLQGHNVEWYNNFKKYDIVYKSKVFTFSNDYMYKINTDKLIKGGTGYSLIIKLDKNIDKSYPDYSLYDCKHAYGFLTRGCPNKCAWCIVPKKEGDLVPYADIDDFIGNYKSVILMDNNILASNYGIKQIEKIILKKIKVDFNQGLDARLIDNSIAKLLSKIKWLTPLRLACDTYSQMKYIEKAVKLLRWYNCTPFRYSVYVLVRDIKDAIERVKFLKSYYLDPFAQVYRDRKNTPPTRDQLQFCRWVNLKKLFYTISWDEYKDSITKANKRNLF